MFLILLFFFFPINAALLQKCQCECQTWITRETTGTRTATRTEESVSTAPVNQQPVSRWALNATVFSPLPVSNTRFIAAVIERHTHTPERRRRYWGRSGTESDHGKSTRRRWSRDPSPSTGRQKDGRVPAVVFPLPALCFGPSEALA